MSRWIARALLACALLEAQPATMSPQTNEILEVLTRFEDAWNRGDVEQMLEVYLYPHVDVNAPGQVMTRPETREYLTRVLAERPSRIRIESDEILVEGDLAFQRGTLYLYPRGGGPEPAADAVAKRYLEILRRDEAGTWRVFWSMDGPIAD